MLFRSKSWAELRLSVVVVVEFKGEVVGRLMIGGRSGGRSCRIRMEKGGWMTDK